MKTIYLVDPYWTGHHLTYIKLFAKSLLSSGHRVVTLCPKSDEVSAWGVNHLPAVQVDRLHTVEFEAPKNGFMRRSSMVRSFILWRHTEKTIAQAVHDNTHHPDLVFFCWIDSYLSRYLNGALVDRLFPYLWSGLYFHPRHLRVMRPKGRFVRSERDLIFSARNCLAVAVLDEGIQDSLQHRCQKPVISFPDIADVSLPEMEYEVQTQIREQAHGRAVIGLLGSLEQRKGLLDLLEIAQQSHDRDWFFVFAGDLCELEFTPDDRQTIHAIAEYSASNCLFFSEYIPDEQKFNAIFNTCDVIFAAYRNFPHSSNMLTKAAFFKKPLLVSGGYCMAERVNQFSLGLVVEVGDIDGYIEALNRLTSGAWVENLYPKPDFGAYYHLHSPDRLQQSLDQLMDLAFSV